MSCPDWAALARAEAFPDDPSAAGGVEWIQTHLSHVYRTGQRVYKFRKPVALGFVCFEARAERDADCLREVKLGRRLAPDVYLGVAPLRGGDATPSVGPPAESLAPDAATREHCVVMRRLPDGRDALSLLEAGALTPAMLDRLADRIALFHDGSGLGRPAPFAPEAWLAVCTGPVEENFRSLSEASAPVEGLASARARAAEFAAKHAERFERRRRHGTAVDAHGDLHLQHVWFERDDAEPLAIDCLEFSESLRHIDAASEVAFLAMDLRYRGAGTLAERFLRRYARERDDFDLYAVVDYFIAYRAGVRAKVAALAARDAEIEPGQRARAAESAQRHVALAADALAPRERLPLVLVAGSVGVGKSSVAAALSERLDGVVVASDRVRKRLLGRDATARLAAAWESGAYTPEHTARTYAGLLERARPVLESGRCALLDATWSRRVHRADALALAEAIGCDAWVVEVTCAPDVARARLARREAAGTDPSDAGPDDLERSAAAFEPPDEWPPARRAEVDTSTEGWSGSLGPVAVRIRESTR